MGKILIIDDSVVFVHDARVALAAKGYQIVIEESPMSGMAAARREAPDLILLGEFAPQLDGLVVLRTLSRDPDTSAVPVIMIAGRVRAADKVRALWQGARDYLVKPVESAMLCKTIDVLLYTRYGEPHRAAASASR